MATELFRRLCNVTIDTLKVNGLRVVFDCTRTLKPEANTASIKVYNLSETSRKQLERPPIPAALAPPIPVEIQCGYATRIGTLFTIFLGNLRRILHYYDGASIVTEVQSGDKEKEIKATRIHRSYPTGTALKTIVKDLAAALGAGEGNLEQALIVARSKGTGSVVTSTGTALSGSVKAELTSILASMGFIWSIQDGALQILDREQALAGLAIKLGPDSGLLGAPSIDNKGVLSCDSLILPDLVPGRLLILDSRFMKGQFRIETVQYKGDTHGNDWNAAITAKRY